MQPPRAYGLARGIHSHCLSVANRSSSKSRSQLCLRIGGFHHWWLQGLDLPVPMTGSWQASVGFRLGWLRVRLGFLRIQSPRIASSIYLGFARIGTITIIITITTITITITTIIIIIIIINTPRTLQTYLGCSRGGRVWVGIAWRAMESYWRAIGRDSMDSYGEL